MTTVTDQRDDIRAELLVHPGAPANLQARDTAWTGSGTYAQLSADELNANAKTVLGKGVDQLAETRRSSSGRQVRTPCSLCSRRSTPRGKTRRSNT